MAPGTDTPRSIELKSQRQQTYRSAGIFCAAFLYTTLYWALGTDQLIESHSGPLVFGAVFLILWILYVFRSTGQLTGSLLTVAAVSFLLAIWAARIWY